MRAAPKTQQASHASPILGAILYTGMQVDSELRLVNYYRHKVQYNTTLGSLHGFVNGSSLTIIGRTRGCEKVALAMVLSTHYHTHLLLEV